tara:strand:+ start:178 stop:582 length:405 start_codon:yes stop_codon:yes gene_type:complete
MHENINNIEVKQGSERSFGFVFAIIFVAISFYLITKDKNIYWLTISISILFFLLAVFKPFLLKKPNILWFHFGKLLNSIISPLVMAIIFLVIVTPIGLIMRMLNKDILNKKFDKSKKNYWQASKTHLSSMKDQF